MFISYIYLNLWIGCKNTVLGEMLRKEINNVLIQETLEQLKRSPSGLDNILKNTISFGIAFHHAGLTMDERDIIEGSFRTGSLRVLIATSTLSSGVNLPARRVIIRSPLFGKDLLNTLTYKQMIGRAGRMGKDSAGESILICKPTERNAALSLLSATLDPIESCLNDSTLLIRALLEAVASEVLYTLEDLKLYMNCTLLSFNKQSDVQTFSNEAIKFLLDNEFLLLQTTERESRWIATPLGKACLAASIPPREGLFLFEELQKARRCFVLDTELHVIYLVTPLSAGCQIGTVDWMMFHELWNTMSESERRVGKLIGVEERFVMSAIRGIIKPDNKTDLPSETVDWNILNIIKVADNRMTFNLFKREVLKKRNIALALHCDNFIDNINSIGSKICTSDPERKRKSRRSGNYTHRNMEIRGVAISWESNIAYYISFSNSSESKVSGKEQMSLLKELFADTALYMRCFAIKDIYKLLYQCCGISAKCRFLDPIIAHWLCTNDSERNFSEMVTQYFPQGNFIMKRTNSYYNAGPGMDVRNSLPGEFRSAAEAVLTWHMMDNVMSKLEELNPVLLYTFREVEMRTVTILACMELSGIGINLKSLQELSLVTLNEMQSLETKSYDLAGRKFNLSSSKEVGQVLGLYKDKKVSTNKAVLEKCDNPISNLVISWRKLSATKTKIIQPLLHLAQKDSRVRGNCITCTVTGRVSMHEPNLQNVPKDFSYADNNFVLSVRMAFVPALGNIMLSADYCQLELRLLTHFSQDPILCEIMRQPGDIFKSITAKWNNVPEEKVTMEMRQRTKQLCYGMIYGMGVKSLAENLCISEPEAQEFLESFMNMYPGIYKWLNDVLEEAHRVAYVTTLLGRRRQLPDLNSTKSSTRAQAERQAVNTKVQGSAADIVKKAMINIEERIRCNFPDSAIVFPEMHATRKLRSNSREMQQRGAYLVLQLHDELLYEVNLADLKEVAAIIRESMENVCQLTIPLPVKVRVGPAWGDLIDYQF